ncbi:MAG TPA: hypothetical protein VE442_01125 [Jatrophihabitans sp.]|nr:hypothetical protein [Jatrophihabitans sp.]
MITVKPAAASDTRQQRVHSAAGHLYDAECALHAAHQSHTEAWITAANEKLHDAVTEYLEAAAGLTRLRP